MTYATATHPHLDEPGDRTTEPRVDCAICVTEDALPGSPYCHDCAPSHSVPVLRWTPGTGRLRSHTTAVYARGATIRKLRVVEMITSSGVEFDAVCDRERVSGYRTRHDAECAAEDMAGAKE